MTDDENAEPEVILCLPRSSDSAPELVPRDTPMDPGAGSADVNVRYMHNTLHIGLA